MTLIYDINTGEELGGGEGDERVAGVTHQERVAGLTRQVEDLTVILRSDDTKAAFVEFTDRVRVLGERLAEALRAERPECDSDALAFEKVKNQKMWETTQALNREAFTSRVNAKAHATSEATVTELWLRVARLESRIAELEAELETRPTRQRQPNHEDQSRFARARRAALKLGRDWTLVESVYDTVCDLPCRFCGGDTGRGIGLGRTDLTVGFVEGNVFPCCGRCGRIRGDRYTVEEMVELVGGG